MGGRHGTSPRMTGLTLVAHLLGTKAWPQASLENGRPSLRSEDIAVAYIEPVFLTAFTALALALTAFVAMVII